MNVSIRFATAADASGVAAVHLRGWVEAYSHLLSPEFFARRDPAVVAERWRATLESPEAGVTYLVAEVDSDGGIDSSSHSGTDTDTSSNNTDPDPGHNRRIIGIASAGPARGDEPPRPRELYMLYVFADHYGTGVGQALFDQVLGDAPASLWVAEDNPRAQAFYRRNGFEPDGARDVIESWENMAEVRMVR